MKIRVLSDLHLEFYKDRGADFIAALPKDDVDVLVLAGDITHRDSLVATLEAFVAHFDPAHVVYVFGNHECYGTSPDLVRRSLHVARTICGPRLHVLDEEVCVIEDTKTRKEHRFVGATLWFKHVPSDPTWALNDFEQIMGGGLWFDAWVREEAKRQYDFLANEVHAGDIVVTHHLPSPKSVHPKYRGDKLNCFFLHDCSKIIESKKPALWIHGHTHETIDTSHLWTRIVCNPAGYPGLGDDGKGLENESFDPAFTVEI